MYDVMADNKDSRLDLRIADDVKVEARAVAKLQGFSLSGLINHLLVEEINKEKQTRPVLLADALKKVTQGAKARVPIGPPSNLKERANDKGRRVSASGRKRAAGSRR